MGLVANSLALLPGTSSFQFSLEMARHSSRLGVPCANRKRTQVEMRLIKALSTPCQQKTYVSWKEAPMSKIWSVSPFHSTGGMDDQLTANDKSASAQLTTGFCVVRDFQRCSKWRVQKSLSPWQPEPAEKSMFFGSF